jgi:hypothetical protein
VVSSSSMFVVSCLISCPSTLFLPCKMVVKGTRIFLSLYAVKDEVAVHLSLRSLDFIHIREFRNIMKLL